MTAKLHTTNVAYFKRKIQLSRFSAHSDGSVPINPGKWSSTVVPDFAKHQWAFEISGTTCLMTQHHVPE